MKINRRAFIRKTLVAGGGCVATYTLADRLLTQAKAKPITPDTQDLTYQNTKHNRHYYLTARF